MRHPLFVFLKIVMTSLFFFQKAQAGELVLFENVTLCEKTLHSAQEKFQLGGPIILDITGGSMGDLVGEEGKNNQKTDETKENPPKPLPPLPEVVPQIIPVVPEIQKKPVPQKPLPFKISWPDFHKKPKPSKPN